MRRLPSLGEFLLTVVLSGLALPGLRASEEIVDLSPDLAGLREEFKLKSTQKPDEPEFRLPAVGAAVILDGKLHALGVAGVRKDGGKARAEPNDAFHLGSCTKAMTGSLIGMLVEQGKLRWDTPSTCPS